MIKQTNKKTALFWQPSETIIINPVVIHTIRYNMVPLEVKLLKWLVQLNIITLFYDRTKHTSYYCNCTFRKQIKTWPLEPYHKTTKQEQMLHKIIKKLFCSHQFSNYCPPPTLSLSSLNLFVQKSSPPFNTLISIHALLRWFGTMLFYWGSDLTLECQNQAFLQPVSSEPHPSAACRANMATRHPLTHLRRGTCEDTSLTTTNSLTDSWCGGNSPARSKSPGASLQF